MDPAALQIDILEDSVNDVLDKLFYSASGGRVIDYAWDAPQPACVNPLGSDEADAWGSSAMNTTFTRVAAEPKRRGVKRVSALSRFTQRGTAKPYYGYKSEPPKSKATAAEEPIGPLAKAIKAAGVLSALSKHKGDKETHVWELLEGTWGVIPDQVKDNAEPDLTNTSKKDEIKFARSPSHMVFGFNSDSPSVTVSMGNYLSQNLEKPYMLDWHAMATTLRFVGEFVKRYIPSEYKPGTSISFSPAVQEARLLNNVDYSVAKSSVQADSPDAVLAKLTAKTFQEFTTGVSSVVTRNNLASSKKSVKLEIGLEVADKLMTAISASGEVRRNRLPKNIFASSSVPTNHDISASMGGKFRKSVIANFNKVSDKWVPTWKSVHSIVWQMFFETNPTKATAVMSVIRLSSRVDQLDAFAVTNYAKELAYVVPKSVGLTIFQLLAHMLDDKEKAIVEFVNMTKEISNSEHYTLESNYAAMYITAIARSSSIDSINKYIQIAYNGYTTRTLGATKLKNLLKDNEQSLIGITRAFESFLSERAEYWSGFYTSRVNESSNHLTALKKVAKHYGTTGFFDLGGELPYNRPFALLNFDRSIKDLSHLRQTISELKVTTIVYSFVALAYKKSQTRVKEDFSAKVFLTPDRLCGVILASADNYARKRKTWGNNLAYDSDEWELVKDKMRRCNRAADMIGLVDDFFEPKVTWSVCYESTKLRFTKSSNSITHMLRKHIAAGFINDSKETEYEDKAMEELDRKSKSQFQSYNLYSILEEDDSESGSENMTDKSEDGKPLESDKDGVEYEDNEQVGYDSDCLKTAKVKGEEFNYVNEGAIQPDRAKTLIDRDLITPQEPQRTVNFGRFSSVLTNHRTKPTTTKQSTMTLLTMNAPLRVRPTVFVDFIEHHFTCGSPIDHKSEIIESSTIVAAFVAYLGNLPESDAYYTDDLHSSDNVDIM